MAHGFSGLNILSNEISFADSVIQDAGGILRVGSQTTLADLKILNADNTNQWESVGTGSDTYGNNQTDLAVTSGQYRIRQSKRRYPYFSGKSQRIETTFDTFSPQVNVIKRVGYFSSNAVAPYNSNLDGFFLETTDTSIVLKVVRNGTETLSKDITEWSNYANMGIYKELSTWNNFTVLEWKFLWLGGAVLTLSVKTENGFIVCHSFHYSGTNPDIFMLSPNQPVRYEIRSTTGSGSFTPICAQVATEGSTGESGESLTVYNPTSITCNSVGTIYALLGIKKQTSYRDIATQIINFEVANTAITSDAGILILLINPTLSAPLSYSNLSRIQIAYATNETITAGTGREIASTQASAGGASSQILEKNLLAWLSSTITDVHEEFILGYMSITANQSVYGILNVKEYV
jgi:hypothetical protein